MKVQVIMDDDMVKRLDKQAGRKGLSRSAYCASTIIQEVLYDERMERKYAGDEEEEK